MEINSIDIINYLLAGISLLKKWYIPAIIVGLLFMPKKKKGI